MTPFARYKRPINFGNFGANFTPTKKFYPIKGDEIYLKGETWKCPGKPGNPSPTGAHYYVGTYSRIVCKYCQNVKMTDNRTQGQVNYDNRKNRQLQSK